MHYLLRKRNSIPLLFLIGALLFLCSFFFTNQALARSLGYKWYSPAGNVTVTFTVPFNDTWKTPIISSMNSWNSVSTKVPLNANGTGTGPHANEFYTVNTTSYTWIGKMFPTVYNYGGEQIFQSADIALHLI